MDHQGTRVEFTETENLSKKSAGRRQPNLVTVEVFENVSTKRFACSPAWSPDSRWSEMIRAPGTKPTPWQRCKRRLFFDSVCTVTQVSRQMRKRAKILKIISKKTDLVVIFSKRQALSRAVVVNSNMSRGKYRSSAGRAWFEASSNV